MQYANIVEVCETHDIVASSATSLDRIRIRVNNKELMCVVVDKPLLYEELKKKNPNIIFKVSVL